MNALQITGLVVMALGIVSGAVMLWRPLAARWRNRGAESSVSYLLTPDSKARQYISSIIDVPATPEQQIEALRAGQSAAQLMRALLEEGKSRANTKGD